MVRRIVISRTSANRPRSASTSSRSRSRDLPTGEISWTTSTSRASDARCGFSQRSPPPASRPFLQVSSSRTLLHSILATTSFEAQVDPVQAAVLVGTAIIPFAYWWYITVPEARLALAKDKRLEGGEAREYLLDLAEDDASRPVERWFFAKWLSAAKPRRASGRDSDGRDRNRGVSGRGRGSGAHRAISAGAFHARLAQE